MGPMTGMIWGYPDFRNSPYDQSLQKNGHAVEISSLVKKKSLDSPIFVGPEEKPHIFQALPKVGVMRYSYGDKMKVEWLCKEAPCDFSRGKRI